MLKNAEKLTPADFAKKTKKRVKKNISFLLQRRKRTTPKSQVTKIVEELMKKDITDFAAVKSFLTSRFDNMPETTIGLYQMLASAKVANGAVNLTDKITNKKLKRFSVLLNEKCRSFSNDRLIIENLYVELSDIFANEGRTLELEFANCADVRSCLVVSPSFKMNGECKKGYYQDFDENFAAIAVDEVDPNIREKLLTFDKKYFVRNFLYKNVNYSVYSHDVACVIASEKIIKDNAGIEMYKKMITFHDGKKFSLDLKNFEIKDKIKYVNMTMSPEEFCPAFLILPRMIIANVAFVCEYNYNDLYESVTKIAKEQGKLHLPSNLFYWNQMNECVDFLGVLALIPNNGISEEDKKVLGNIYDDYKILKPVLSIIGNIKLRSVACIKEFYNSFTTKINFDKLQNIQKKLVEIKEDTLRAYNSEYYKPCINFITNLNERYQNAAQCAFLQLSTEFISVLQEMDDAIQSMIDGKSGNIIDELKKISQKIYLLTPCGEPGHTPAIPWLFSAGAHLGTISYDLIDSSLLQQSIEKHEEKKEREKIIEQGEEQRMRNVLNNLREYQKQIIINTINYYNQVRKLGLSEELKNDLASGLINSIAKDKNFEDEINKNIVKTVMDKGGIHDEYINKLELLDKLIEEKSMQKKIVTLQKQINKKESELNAQMNKLQAIQYDKDDQGSENESMLRQEDTSSKITQSSMRSNLSNYIAATSDTLGILEDVYRYLTNRTNKIIINGGNGKKFISKGGRVEHWLKNLIYATNIFGIKGIDDSKIKNMSVLELLENFPISHDILNKILQAGLVPNLRLYLLEKEAKSLPLKQIAIRSGTMRINNNSAANGGFYIPRVFYSGEVYPVKPIQETPSGDEDEY